jgi:hypothetical protein
MIRTENYAIKWLKKWEVTSYYGFDEKQILFYQSTENGSINEQYRIALNGKSKLALSKEVGTNDAQSLISILYQRFLVLLNQRPIL